MFKPSLNHNVISISRRDLDLGVREITQSKCTARAGSKNMDVHLTGAQETQVFILSGKDWLSFIPHIFEKYT